MTGKGNSVPMANNKRCIYSENGVDYAKNKKQAFRLFP